MSRLPVVRTIALPGLLAFLAGLLAARQPSGASGRGGRPAIPPIDTAIADRGQLVYAANCAWCHGPDARGTARGADLVHAYVRQFVPPGTRK